MSLFPVPPPASKTTMVQTVEGLVGVSAASVFFLKIKNVFFPAVPECPKAPPGMRGQDPPRAASLLHPLMANSTNVQGESQDADFLQGSWGSSPTKWRPFVSPLWPWARHLHGGHAITNSEATEDNQRPLLSLRERFPSSTKRRPLPLCTPSLVLWGHQVDHECRDNSGLQKRATKKEPWTSHWQRIAGTARLRRKHGPAEAPGRHLVLRWTTQRCLWPPWQARPEVTSYQAGLMALQGCFQRVTE